LYNKYSPIIGKRNPHPLKNCLDNFKKSWRDLDKLSKINENWKNLIGLELFQECKPLNIEKKILTIAVNHPQWRQALIYNKHKLKERIEKIGITLNEIKIIQNYEIKNKNIKFLLINQIKTLNHYLKTLFMYCIGMEIGFYYLIKQYSLLVVHVVRNSFLGLVILLTDYNSI